MDTEFWQQRWDSNKIDFHQRSVNALLVKHLEKLSLTPGNRIFLPLCGKTLDIHWLLAKEYRIVGSELSEKGH